MTKPIRVHENDRIALSDGTTLSALIWLPEDAETDPVPAILEFLPYRKRDGTAMRDALTHPYFAAHGYACVRVDMRGTGDSDGELLGEYLQQEQDDALEILAWIAAQPWCSGNIGMIGISWGGFNGLQVAARRPKQLKAVISLCSTDDRYDNDVHYMGGCQLVENFLWASTMLSVAPAPPDPVLVGEKWRDIWLQRLEAGAPYFDKWHAHQRRDDFWKHASICEDYNDVECPVFLVSGWLDAYTNSVFRMLDHLRCPRRALVGPWAHKYPHFAHPGPEIGFLQECLRWWDKWLKGKETGIMDEPMLRSYLQDTAAPTRTFEGDRPGRWVAEASWPSKGILRHFLSLAPGSLLQGSNTSSEHVSFSSPQTTGFTTGRWIPYGADGDAPDDQRLELAEGVPIFDSQPLEEPLDLLGAPIAHLRISSDQPNALVAAVLSEVLPNGSATRLSYGLLNLTHRDSPDHLTNIAPLEPGKFYDVAVRLNECGQRLSSGSVLRLSLSSSYFFTCWPSSKKTTLTVDCAHSKLELPRRLANPLDDTLKPFPPSESAPPLPVDTLREPSCKNTLTRDLVSNETTICYDHDEGHYQDQKTGWRWGGFTKVACSMRPDDPLSGRAEHTFRQDFGRETLDLAIRGHSTMTATETDWHITTRLEGWEQNKRIFERDNDYVIPRDHV